MSIAEMDRLVTDYTSNNELQSLFGGAVNFDEAVKVARGAGYDVETEEARTYLKQIQDQSATELTDTQLDAVSGGKKSPGGPGSMLTNPNNYGGNDFNFPPGF